MAIVGRADCVTGGKDDRVDRTESTGFCVELLQATRSSSYEPP
jgi:hypothetical protein